MLLPEDDFPLHQSAQPLSQVMGGHPNAYDRFWFNGYDDTTFFAFALGLYPNRGVIDAAFSVVHANASTVSLRAMRSSAVQPPSDHSPSRSSNHCA